MQAAGTQETKLLESMPELQYLDEVAEWKIFGRVQPLLAKDIPWRLSDPHLSSGDILLDSFKTFFTHDLDRVLDLCPNHGLSKQEFVTVLETLNDFLGFLEDLISDTILDKATEILQAKAREIVRAEVNGTNATYYLSVCANRQKATRFSALFDYIAFWRQSTPNFDKSAIVDVAGDGSCSDKAKLDRTFMDDKFPRASALGDVVYAQRGQNNDLETLYEFLHLDNSLTTYREAEYSIRTLKECMETLHKEIFSIDRGHSNENFLITKWDNFAIAESSSGLYTTLCRKFEPQFVSCKGHQAFFRLNGFDLEALDRAISFDLFLSVCSEPEGWREGKCICINR